MDRRFIVPMYHGVERDRTLLGVLPSVADHRNAAYGLKNVRNTKIVRSMNVSFLSEAGGAAGPA